jgi:hypothetical protein
VSALQRGHYTEVGEASGSMRGEGHIRAEEIGKRLDGWAMARVVMGVLDEREVCCQLQR